MSFVKDISSSIVLFALTVFLWLNLEDAPESVRYYPRALLYVLGALVILLVAATLVRHSKRQDKGGLKQIGPDGETSELSRIGIGTLLVLGLSLLYILSMPYLGFTISSALLLVVFMVALGVRNPLVLVLVPLVEIGILVFVFEYLLALLLPDADWLRTMLGY